MTRMIEDTAFRAEFAAFCDENGYGISAGDDANYGDDTTETRDTLADFIAAQGDPEVDETRNGHRFIMIRNGKRDIFVADNGEARLAYVG